MSGQKYLMKAVTYQRKMNFLFPKSDTTLDFLAERPGKITNKNKRLLNVLRNKAYLWVHNSQSHSLQ